MSFHSAQTDRGHSPLQSPGITPFDILMTTPIKRTGVAPQKRAHFCALSPWHRATWIVNVFCHLPPIHFSFPAIQLGWILPRRKTAWPHHFGTLSHASYLTHDQHKEPSGERERISLFSIRGKRKTPRQKSGEKREVECCGRFERWKAGPDPPCSLRKASTADVWDDWPSSFRMPGLSGENCKLALPFWIDRRSSGINEKFAI